MLLTKVHVKAVLLNNATKVDQKQLAYHHTNKKALRVKCLGGHSSPGILWTSAQSVIVSMIPIPNIEQFNRCQIYDVSQSNAHNNQVITSSCPVGQQSNTMVTPTQIVTTEAIMPSNLSYLHPQEGVR